MSHYAELDEENVVVRVLVCSDDDQDALEFLALIGGRWMKTSYNTRGGVHANGGTPLRMNFAGEGYAYDAARDAFIPPRPTEGEWVLDEATCLWVEAP